MDLRGGDPHHFLWMIGEFEKGRGDEVHADVGALGGEQHGDEQGERVRVIERDRGFRIELLEPLPDVIRALLLQHRVSF